MIWASFWKFMKPTQYFSSFHRSEFLLNIQPPELKVLQMEEVFAVKK